MLIPIQYGATVYSTNVGEGNRVLVTSSVCPHKPREIKALADWGFDFVLSNTVFPSHEWEKEIADVHSNGMKFIARWPNIGYLGLNDSRYAFQSYDCQSNTGRSGRIDGPSHWNKAAEQIAVDNLMSLVNMGIDGVLVNMLGSDRPFPTDWYPFPNSNGQLLYWSFDEEAQRRWAEYSGGQPMPEIPHALEGKCTEGQSLFYRWYQDGWISRLIRLSDMAIDAGIKHIWTYFVPLTNWTIENMAGGTAGCLPYMDNWYKHVLDRDCKPVVVIAELFPLDGHWWTDACETIDEIINAPYEWTVICGAETGENSFDDGLSNLTKHSLKAAQMGMDGLYCGDFELLKGDYSKIKDSFATARDNFAMVTGHY